MRLEKLALWLWRRLPMKWRHTAMCWEMGALTTTHVLAHREVPTITVEEFMGAMKVAERVRVNY